MYCEVGCPCPKSDCLTHKKKNDCVLYWGFSGTTKEYRSCVIEMKPLQTLCQENCPNKNVICQNACFDRYGMDLKACPCQVKSNNQLIRVTYLT